MTNTEIVQNILTQFGKIIDLEPLALNEEGSCRLVFDGETELNLELLFIITTESGRWFLWTCRKQLLLARKIMFWVMW